MYKKNFIFLLFFNLVINIINVSAFQYNSNYLFYELKNKLLGLLMPNGEFNWNLMISFAVFTVLAYMFSDALLTFSPLSRRASIAVGILMAIVALSTGFIKNIADFLTGITERLGYFGTIITLIIIVVVYFVWRILSSFLIKILKK